MKVAIRGDLGTEGGQFVERDLPGWSHLGRSKLEPHPWDQRLIILRKFRYLRVEGGN